MGNLEERTTGIDGGAIKDSAVGDSERLTERQQAAKVLADAVHRALILKENQSVVGFSWFHSTRTENGQQVPNAPLVKVEIATQGIYGKTQSKFIGVQGEGSHPGMTRIPREATRYLDMPEEDVSPTEVLATTEVPPTSEAPVMSTPPTGMTEGMLKTA